MELVSQLHCHNKETLNGCLLAQKQAKIGT